MLQGILREIGLGKFTPSFSLAAYKNGKEVFSYSYPDFLVYDCASITKPLVSFVILKKFVDLNLDVREIFPFFPYSLKVKEFATHISGLIPWLPLYLYPEDYLVSIVEKGFKGERGKKVYSCLNYIALKYVAEKLTGKKFKTLAGDFLKDYPGCFLPPLKCVNVAPTERGNLFEYNLAKKFVKNPNVKKFRLNKPIKGQTHDLNSHYSKGIAGNSGLFANVFGVSDLMLDFLKLEDFYLPLFETEDYFYHFGFTGTGIAVHKKKDAFVVFLSNRICPEVRDIPFSEVRHKLFTEIFRLIL